jgi:hypothetical protein
MSIQTPPLPPDNAVQSAPAASQPASPIKDVRDQFARPGPETAEDKERTRAFIDGKIEMVRRDPHMSEAEKAAAIAELEAKR